MAHDFDVLIVGSGPSGAHAADELVRSGFKVGLVDIGFTDTKYESLVPPKPFAEIRRSEKNQKLFFLGENPETVFRNQSKAGVHLTPTRQHMIRDAEKLFPLISDTFVPLQSSGLGGLGISWGANAFAFEDSELNRIGLPTSEMRRFYRDAVARVGVSGPAQDDLTPLIGELGEIQPALPIDSNAQAIYDSYKKRRESYNRDGFVLGQSLLAMLSKPLDDRKPNPLYDMDFWSDIGRSVYRPRYTVAQLQKFENFKHLPGRLAVDFQDTNEGVKLQCKNLESGAGETLTAKRLILAAGAINSGRILLSSLKDYDAKIPILCNTNYWIAALNLPMLGQPARDARHSLAQITALMRSVEDPSDYVLGQFYSYRSLLMFRLLKDIPLPPKLGMLFLRLMITSFTCINVHFSDKPSPLRWLQLRKRPEGDALFAQYGLSGQEVQNLKRNERKLLKTLLSLKCVPLGVTKPAPGASIHYAGTIPFSEMNTPLTCASDGRLHAFTNVYVGDGSSWKFLPAKGLTVSLMANARRVAYGVGNGLKR